uniref:Fatty acid desaturase domain-containing protein n=1 Tax=Chrysotila carterae TaxID=13221 RepID=A0A7S4C6P3_CHRCT
MAVAARLPPTLPPRPAWVRSTRRWGARIAGTALLVNFLLFWAIPIAFQGQAFHLGLKRLLIPVYTCLDQSQTLRKLALRYVYSKPQYCDFAATAVFTLASVTISFGTVLGWQLKAGNLPAWLIAAYNCAWVGFGGRVMGAAYTFAHKEGHNALIYQRWLRYSVGNVFENWVGTLFGNVPYNFTTSHVHIHHALDGGKGDTFYMWDVDRSSVSDFLLFISRILLHMTGISSLRYFYHRSMWREFNLLLRGCLIYWVLVPTLLYAVTRSGSFLMWVWLQPLFCMTTFLAVINWGFHGFIHYDDNGKHVECVNASTLIDGRDDSFGEDDHMAHHYSTQTWYTDVETYRQKIMDNLKKYHGSVFKSISIPELSIMIMVGDFDRLAEQYVDYTGKMSKSDIAQMLRTRAKHKEIEYDEYHEWCRQAEAAARAAG